MRVVGRIAELGGDQLLELLGEHVLEHLGLVVHAVPRHAERLAQVGLEQAVVPDDLERDPFPRTRQRDSSIRFVHCEAERCQLLHHRAGGGRRDALPLRERGHGHAVSISAELVDLAQIVLDRIRQRRLSHSPTVCRLRHYLSRSGPRAAPVSTLALAKAASLGCERVRPWPGARDPESRQQHRRRH